MASYLIKHRDNSALYGYGRLSFMTIHHMAAMLLLHDHDTKNLSFIMRSGSRLKREMTVWIKQN